MAKSVNLSNMNDDVDKKFEKMSTAVARKIDNGGTMPKSKSKTKTAPKKKSSK